MKIYLRLSPHNVEMEMKAIEKGGVLKNKMYPTLTAIDFGNGLINLRNQKEYDKNKERVEEFFKKNMTSILELIHKQNILKHCELDNIIEIDENNKKIHIGYADEFGLE